MTEMIGTYLTIVGLLMTLAGVILLFLYGMPFRVRTGGTTVLELERIDQNAIRAERFHEISSWCGLVLIVLGTLAQIMGVLI